MPDEHESAVAAWLADPTTQREIQILRDRFTAWRESDVYLFAVMMEILTGMDFYGTPPITEIQIPKPDEDEDGDGESWKRGYHDPDATGTP